MTTAPSGGLRALFSQGYTFGYSSVDLYRILHDHVLDSDSPNFGAPLGVFAHDRKLATAADRTVVALNVDTLYSSAWIDLRGGPTVLVVPPFGEDRYVSAELFDLYTYIVGYVTPRTHGRSGGRYFLVGPGWSGDTPDGIEEVFRSPTELMLVFMRTQLLDAEDIAAVHELQDEFALESSTPATAPAPMPSLPEPIDVRATPTTRFFDILGWMLSFMPPLEQDRELRERLTAAGVGRSDWSATLADDDTAQVLAGMAEGAAQLSARVATVRSSAELFGSRDFFAGDHVSRSVGAMLGILGNAAEEYLGVGYAGDDHGKPFDGATYDYEITFQPGDEPPVGAFWSITLYDADRFLYDNHLDRYKVDGTTLAEIEPAADGGRTILIRHDEPLPDQVAGWLPCPATPFTLTFRTYLPGAPVRDGSWSPPPVRRHPRLDPS
jgi:hypothetical protein